MKDKQLCFFYYSPCTFSNANPSDNPNIVIKIHVIAAVTISAFANGKICRINAIIFKISKFLQSLKPVSAPDY